MKRQHKINFGWERPSDPISSRYQGEIDAALRKAEKAYRKAQQTARRAEIALARNPDPELLARRDEAIRDLELRERELAEIRSLMAAPVRPQAAVVHRAGRQERLEVGTPRKPKKPRRRSAPVKTRRMP